MSPSGEFSMTGGIGPQSYAKNSSFQGNMSNLVKKMLEEAISEKLDISSCPPCTRLNIADFGCSVGPNTFSTMQTITETLTKKIDANSSGSCMPDLLVYFIDRTSNDFNTLFRCLPANRKYFAAGVPGSFYGRLLPKATLHVAHSAITLHWLSEVPREVADKNSAAWNEGKITYVGGPEEVVGAYEKQFTRDFDGFLSARAEEIVDGGILALLVPLGDEDRKPCNTSLTLVLVESSLQDMVSEVELLNYLKTFFIEDKFGELMCEVIDDQGLIEKGNLDSFNMPLFFPSVKEVAGLVESNGRFNMERMERVWGSSDAPGLGVMDAKTLAMHTRAGLQPIMRSHFGDDIMDQVFGRLEMKIGQRSRSYEKGGFLLPALFLLLKRKA